jgi:uncharacterized protein (DUF2141 family)
MTMYRTLRRAVLGAFLAAALPAETVVVVVSGIQDREGEIGCALFPRAEGFPMNTEKSAAAMRVKPQSGSVECRFEGVAPGAYAVAVSHDRNGNGKTDTNLVGIPKEDWGVSNNVRPRMRPPKFDEAAFTVAAGRETRIDVRLGR